MRDFSRRQFQLSRAAGRAITRAAAILTLGRMPPFVSTSAIVTDAERLLVVVDAIRDEPVLPGGHLRWSELPENALVREVREETGLVIEPHELVAALAGEDSAGEQGVVRLIYTASVAGGVLASSAEGEAMWLALERAPQDMQRDGHIVERWRARTR